jgi:hypothetical protein
MNDHDYNDGYFGQRRGESIVAPDFDFDLNLDDLKSSIITSVFKLLANEVKDTAYWSMPIVWDFGDDPTDGEDGPPIDDPTTIDVSVSLYIDVEYRFSFRQLVLGEIHDAIYDADGKGSHRGMLRLRDELRKLADEIDAKFNEQPGAAAPPVE